MADFRGTDRIRNAIAAFRRSFRHVRSLRLKRMTHLTFYRVPIAITAVAVVAIAGVALSGYRYVEANTSDYYRVMVNGNPIGEVSSKDKIEEWLERKETELQQADTPVLAALDENQISYVSEKAYKAKPDDEATLSRLDGVLKTHAIGVQIVVDGKPVGVVRDQETADALLARIKNKYAPKSAAKKTAPTKVQIQSLSAVGDSAGATALSATAAQPFASVEFVEQVTTREARIGGTAPSDPEKLFQKLLTGNPAPIKYTVREGDCVGCIAEKMGVSPELIYQKNPWIKDDLVKVGDVLDMTALKPVINVQSTEQVTQIEPIEAVVEYQKNETMRAGETKVLRQGKDGKREVTYRLVKRNGFTVEEEIVAEKVMTPAVSTLIMKGTKVVLGEGTGRFAWPVLGARITSYLGKRWGRMHEGIDMVGNKNIMAADNGVIEFAGYKSGGLGNAIIINHKNGFKTVYGHMKSLKVKKGQVVEKGDIIGIMGSTGRSTGTHLHFEVHLNGKLKNPTSYL